METSFPATPSPGHRIPDHSAQPALNHQQKTGKRQADVKPLSTSKRTENNGCGYLVRLSILECDLENPLSDVWSLLKACPSEWVCDRHSDFSSAARQIKSTLPDALLLGVESSHDLASQCLLQINDLQPSLPVIVVSKCRNPQAVLRYLMSGARGCLLDPVEPQELMQAVRAVRRGGVALCQETQRILLECLRHAAVELENLSRRQKQIINLLFEGLSDKEIADKLLICPGTVHIHLAKLYKKLRVHNRGEVLVKFFKTA